jgi:hypothetical protein
MVVDSYGLIQWVPQHHGIYGPITILVSDGGGEESEPAIQEISVTVNPLSQLIDYCFNFRRPRGANLISFYALPEDTRIEHVFASLGENITGIITEGGGASQIAPGVWVGSVMNIFPEKGYWILISDPEDLCLEDAMPSDPLMTYSVKEGANLISFPSEGVYDLSEVLTGENEIYLSGVITDGNAASQIAPGVWVGSLTTFKEGIGYWFISLERFDFQYNLPSDVLVRDNYQDEEEKLLAEFNVHQSTKQAFYFIKNILIQGSPISSSDWILVYNGETLVGKRRWNGSYTDVPAMGFDNRIETVNYSDSNSKLTLKILRESGEIAYIKNELPLWVDNGLFILGLLEAYEIPKSYKLNEPYPNPFNPVTNIRYDIAYDSQIELSIYDMRGRLVEVLHDGFIEAGSYKMTWSAKNISSGIYFLRMITPESSITQKMVLMK